MRNALRYAAAVLLCSCLSGDAQVLPAEERGPDPAEAPTLSQMVAPEPDEEEVSEAEIDESVEKDPYRGWSNWCEPQWYESECKSDKDCEGKGHPSHRGAPLRCLRPWWAEKGADLKICSPGGASKTERRWRDARLREIVSQLGYFNELEHCDWHWESERRPGRAAEFHRRWENGGQMHQQHWRCQREWALAEKLTSFLSVPYQRETGRRPFKRHRLDADQQANETAWVKQASTYGWVVELGCEVPGRSVERCPRFRNGPRKGKKRIIVRDYYPDPNAKTQNPHYGDQDRWRYGLGPFGQNAAYGVQDWDKMAPPEALCLEAVSVEAYLRDARHAVRVYRGERPPTCAGEIYRGRALRNGMEVQEPSWVDVHRVASGGNWCPRSTSNKKSISMLANFKEALRRHGIDADEPVTELMLGNPVPREGQWARAVTAMRAVEEQLPPPWEDG